MFSPQISLGKSPLQSPLILTLAPIKIPQREASDHMHRGQSLRIKIILLSGSLISFLNKDTNL
jgi:hypothetical protein